MATPPSVDVPSFKNESHEELNHELEQCPPEALRLILRDICDRNHDVAEALYKALCISKRPPIPAESAAPTPKHATPVIDLTGEPSPDYSPLQGAASSSKKRKALDDVVNDNTSVSARSKKSKVDDEISWKDRYVHCVQCYEMFDVMDNDDESCCYHDGYLEVDYELDFWADHDEDCHGTIDSLELRNEYPEGYTWNCCDQSGDTEGCMHGPHRRGKVLKHQAEIRKAGGLT
ncbi:hypothetical protein H2198_007320 [Neophaeococcomyces mojaviensis]|uniref:Uncharacterized protein n=1 Tax=Neophaeococcomyces mojaviensis TaxID=3383035 RepID=A0ACC3A0Q5_9EURO|nr:hypothetical protein H2198_007320 [Knufia sp. JES_112]